MSSFAHSPNVTTAVARRGIAALAASGLVVAVAATGATADSAAPRKVDILTRPGTTAAVITTPTVKVPGGTHLERGERRRRRRPARSPKPAPAVVRERPAASRSGERAALPGTDRASAPAARAATPATAPAPAAPEPAPAPAPAAPPASASAAVNLARQHLGTPYVYGGNRPGGFDCSGFTQYVFAQFGVSLPRSSSQQRYAGTVISAAEARPGDLVWGPGHVGIYTGNGNHIAARNPGTPLSEGPIYMSSPVFIRVL